MKNKKSTVVVSFFFQSSKDFFFFFSFSEIKNKITYHLDLGLEGKAPKKRGNNSTNSSLRAEYVFYPVLIIGVFFIVKFFRCK